MKVGTTKKVNFYLFQNNNGDGKTVKAPGTWGYCGKYCPLGYKDKCKNRKRIPRFLEEWKIDPNLKVNLVEAD